MLKKILQGMVVGIANIIPGVSGGTMMVAMGLYDKLIHSITHLKSDFKNSMKLLIPIFLGAGIAIVALSRLFEFLLREYPIPTNFAFCGLIAGSLPFIFKKVQGHKTSGGKIAAFIVFFAVVILMALLGETGGKSADVTLGVINVIKLLFVGIIAAATMVVPGVSGSMMLMLLGYYDTIIRTINRFIDALVSFDMGQILTVCGVLIPFGIGVVLGIFLIAKLIEFIFRKAEIHAYYGILGLIIASPIAILLKTDWSGGSVLVVGIGIVTFIAGWFVASKLGGE
ncbi:DUF368 domain-containing protein [Faecalicatena acetigenes]|uniref:DUF368 domain-containing protein n=1 Tax=Faecalicatena acetigenes TaxID=2981790 RepID=A0ABT2TBI4_9FIRM|nr:MULTISPECIES: DUF368 domain-containing protein [Lachnospiraceae]MCU6747633.1 DUF368 domain-containing protein [Faecalicatena acetigenes]SCH99929.1 Domain of uncharacterised function (DUF368) [uncultured Clostridium sp.]